MKHRIFEFYAYFQFVRRTGIPRAREIEKNESEPLLDDVSAVSPLLGRFVCSVCPFYVVIACQETVFVVWWRVAMDGRKRSREALMHELSGRGSCCFFGPCVPASLFR